MKKFYSIGETAEILGVSTTTLRYYDRKKIISPNYTDPATGYRYYVYDQFQAIDRIKYLQGLGMSLETITEAVKEGTVDHLLAYLEEHKKILLQEREEIDKKVDDVDWYLHYWRHTKDHALPGTPYHAHFPDRYILEVPFFQNESYPDADVRLTKLRTQPPFDKLRRYRQYGYRMMYDTLMKKQFRPVSYFALLNGEDISKIQDEHFFLLPEGDYICFLTHLMQENWETEILKSHFANADKNKFVIALEFEDNLNDFTDSLYEVQVPVE